MEVQETDVLIIGGGIAGCIAAIALAPFYSVSLIDKLAEPPERIGECLAPAARRILKQLDLLKGLEEGHLQNLGTQSYWGSNQLQIVDHLRNPDGFGWYLNRRAFESYLRKSVIDRGVNTLWPFQLKSCSYQNQFWKVLVQAKNKAY